MKFTFKLLLVALSCSQLIAQPNTNIRLNQIGFYTNGPKIAAVVTTSASTYSLKSTDQTIEYAKGNLSNSSTWAQSGETVKIADFSNFSKPGNYVLVIDGLGYSYPFVIQDQIFLSLNKAIIKAFYFNRSSTALEPQYAGKWARASGHPDNNVIVHAAAASAARPAGTIISSPKGWYDAGDYNSYIVNSGISTYSLLISYEHFKIYYDTLNLNIPESSNSIPDLLDEIKWNLDWMLTMQDPNDGGVYNKKTNANFDAFVMPDQTTTPRYVVQKSTSSACDFAAVMATAYRIYKNYDDTYATVCLEAAKKAYAWGLANPSVTFMNPTASGIYPAVVTGGYGDSNLNDELEWAGNELYIATQDEGYYKFNNSTTYGIPTWGNVRTLGLFSLIYNRKNLTSKGFADTTNTKNKLLSLADKFKDYQTNTSPYKVVMGINGNSDFVWGSNSQAANMAMILLNAYFINNNIDYAKAALSQMDYIMGRNALGISYVTGFGSKKVMNIHHRPSGGDDNIDPVPGWVVGGPTGSTGDGCLNNATYLAKSFYDQEACYTKTEVAINWNAPAVYLTGALEFHKIFNNPILVDGLHDNSNSTRDNILIYPVPAQNIVELDFESGSSSDGNIILTDLTGKIVLKQKVSIKSGLNSIPFSVSYLNDGNYLIKIECDYQTITKKFLIQR